MDHYNLSASTVAGRHVAPFPTTRLAECIQSGGPRESDHDMINELIHEVCILCKENPVALKSMNEQFSSSAFMTDPRSVIGHVRTKPYGYAGDFMIIDRIYTETGEGNPYEKWDKYMLQQPAAQAVRNRKKYFIDLVSKYININAEGHPVELLNIASGPGRDLKELYDSLSDRNGLHTTCVEMDERAIEYASDLNKPDKERITFVNKNAFRFHTKKKFDIIWSAGLFDYFNDAQFVHLLRSLGSCLKPGGRMVIGNFNDSHNPSRGLMEFFGDWHLNHRTRSKLRILAVEAGFESAQVQVRQEPERINLFLHIKM